MRRASRAFGYSLLGLLLAVVAEACSASAGGPRNGPTAGTGGSSGLGNMDATTVDAPTEGGMGGVPTTEYDALCGVTVPGGCVPDDVSACLFAMGGQSGRGGGGAGSGGAGTAGNGGAGNSSGLAGEAGFGGESGGGGQGGEPAIGQAGSGAQSAGGASGSAGAGTSGSAGMDGGLARYSCQVGVRRSEPHASCVLSGAGEIDAPCLRGSDCQPSLACVGNVAGRCRPYCCDHTACGAVPGTHCAAEPLLGVPEIDGEAPTAPVCVPAAECSLAQDYPCKGTGCTCPEDTACMVVSDEGKTSCVVPGDGSAGQACPCQWGHVCSKATNECVKLCQTAAPGDDCGSGRCQAAPVLPPGWGVCVGHVPESG
jgi:hypothetical protein